ncbi:MAG: hypothetical protein CMJ83_15135 [Planctomycetes bacterium]|nr:hypothetical protein [Planctomycetota bacterium]
MRTSAHKGTLLLTLAQVWHALSGYLIFLHGARVLGIESYGNFMLVVWTMTTLEIFVVDGVPRSVSWWISKVPECTRGIAWRGFLITTAIAAGLAAVLAAAAPVIGGVWGDPSLVKAVQLSGLDFLAFAGFAVLVQAINGLQRYGTQALVWFTYSTAKVAAVLAFLNAGWGVEGGVLGYIVGSLVGSLAAFVSGAPLVARFKGRDLPRPGQFFSFGMPVATQALALMALVNVDLWAAKRSAASPRLVGAYGAAATLGRALFFVFKAFGDALFPAVARAWARGDVVEARRIASKGLAQLLCFVVPTCGLATGAAEQVLVTLYGDEEYRAGGVLLVHLAPSSVLWTLTAVFGALVAAAGRPGAVATSLTAVLVAAVGIVYAWADLSGVLGAARGSVVVAALGCLATGALMLRILGPVIPWGVLATTLVAALVFHSALTLWSPPSWWVFPYGALLLAAWLAAARKAEVMPGAASPSL